MYHEFFIYLSVDGCLGCFQILALVNNAAVDIRVLKVFSLRVVFWELVPISFRFGE